MGFDCVSRTHVGLRRKLNEDAVLDCPDRRLWAVADGMGGHEAGEVASAKVVAALDSLDVAERLDDYADAVLASLERANGALLDMGRSGLQQRTIGSTVVGLIADSAEYACFWAGDSRAYRLSEGTITQLTRDHSLVQDLVDAGMIEANQAEHHPNANVVTRAVGAADRLQVDTVTGPMLQGDTFLLASDGLTRLVSDAELRHLLSAAGLDAVADRMIDLALERGAPDNVSFVIVRVT
jgi:serine/threonine protein phosphatase Stp1